MLDKSRVEVNINRKLHAAFQVAYLSVVNESHMHSVPENSETHFQVTLVAGEFEGVSMVKRHQRVFAVLADELAAGVHALALHTYTMLEWDKRLCAPNSPACLGGSAKESS